MNAVAMPAGVGSLSGQTKAVHPPPPPAGGQIPREDKKHAKASYDACMANNETPSPALSTRQIPDGKQSAVEQAGEGASTLETLKDSAGATTTTTSPPSVSAQGSIETIPQQGRPSLAPSGSSQSTLPTTPFHAKKFSAVNVNKKFLEKTAQAASATASSTSSLTKSSTAAARPAAPSTASPSRLVTAKLTAIPISSTAGWSRQASAAPSSNTANNSPNSTTPLPTSATASNATSAAPQLPHVGKVIQPQPKALGAPSQSSMKETHAGGKPVWGNLPSAPVRLDIPTDDFPTAAEVAQGSISSAKKLQSEESKHSAEAVKQARLEDADAFRGVHLDPNAHHWDEMEEDDDDFLGGVVEFGDGRQYKVESVDGAPSDSSAPAEPKSIDRAEKVRDRFVDDFDRSWPKSTASPTVLSRDLPGPQEAIRSPTTSVKGLHPSSSPVDSSRVLFNERSNRLEPYSHSRQGQPPNLKRPGFHDPDGRHSRDFAGPQNVQVLHKPPLSDFGPRNRRFSGASNTSGGHPSSPRDNHFSRRDGPPSSPRMTREAGHLMTPSTSHGGRDRDGGRRGTMGPPPVPPRALKSAQDSGRHLPPHLTQMPPSRRETRSMHNEPLTPASPKVPSLPSHSPLSSHAQLSAISPVIASVTSLPLPVGPDIEEARKDVMHSAAARAKQRREQEEAEREAQKERARRKAQELEEKMKAAEAEKTKAEAAEHEASQVLSSQSLTSQDAIVNSIIEDAVKSAQLADPQHDRSGSFPKPGILLPGEPSKRPSTLPRKTSTVPANPDSWRSNVTIPSAPAFQQRKSSSGFVASATAALDAAVEEELEIDDFSDMGKLVDNPRSPSPPGQTRESAESIITIARPPRPVASDFFEDKQVASEPEKTEPLTWRQKLSTLPQDPMSTAPGKDESEVSEESVVHSAEVSSSPQGQSPVEQPGSPNTTSMKDLSSAQDQNGRNIVNLPSPLASGPPRTPRSQAFYKEATMSSLNDTMSRIKGAIVHMKSHEAPTPSQEPYSEPSQTRAPATQTSLRPPFREKWVPPALRPRSIGFVEDEDREVFDVTVVGLTHSPPPADLSVRLPKQSRPVDSINRRQLHLFHRPPNPARFEILTFEPPVEGMSKRDLSLNYVLFGKPVSKGKPKYRVFLPRTRQMKPALRAFGKPLVADNTGSWRKPAVAPVLKSITPTIYSTEDTGLETMSRSPPPGILLSETITSIPKPNEVIASKAESQPAVRSRPQPKMPAGSAVVVMRDSRIDVIESNVKSLVNFIVSDELEEAREPAQTMESLPADVPASSLPNGLTSQKRTPSPISHPAASPQMASNQDPFHDAALRPLKNEAKSFDSTTLVSAAATAKTTHLTPTVKAELSALQPASHQTSPWSRSSLAHPPLKESTSRGPDPEHLKALWSQPPEKAEFHPVNSLEAIPDDLTSLPFTLHEVKSEDGATPPPPIPQPPSRMSLHDVTRAFQQVPQSSATNTARPSISPPSTNAPVARPTYPVYTPLPPNGMRPPYASYPPSPAPSMGMMYPHPPPMTSASPVPGRMQVNPQHPPPYAQWIPMMGSPVPNANMMRPAPYPTTQMMAYGTSNNAYPQHPSAPPNMMVNQHHHHQTPQNGRTRTMPMSPALSHSSMYPTSPMLVHAHAHPPGMQIPQNHGYAMSAGRGQPRADSGSHLGSQHPTSTQQQAHVLYPHSASSAPFARSSW